MADLHLNLKGEYFDAIKDGSKQYEFRSFNTWRRRLEDKTFNRIIIKRGYPRKDDFARIIERPWRGYELHTIVHPHFGAEPVTVFAIIVN